MTRTEADFAVSTHSSIVLLEPLTPAAHRWTARHLPDALRAESGGVAIDRRYADDILAGLERGGLRVRRGWLAAQLVIVAGYAGVGCSALCADAAYMVDPWDTFWAVVWAVLVR
jgi:hypothetical protein